MLKAKIWSKMTQVQPEWKHLDSPSLERKKILRGMAPLAEGRHPQIFVVL